MTDLPTRDTFAQCLNDTFAIGVDDSTSLPMALIEVAPLPDHAPGKGASQPSRAPFSLVFRGPKEPVLPQRIYRFEHEHLGDLEIFIVPIGPDDEGMRYEAVFN
jgi:hypothetical protein